MPITVTQDGRDLVCGEEDRVLYFRELNLDWVAGGYTLKLFIKPPGYDLPEVELSSVVGDVNAAKKEGTAGLLPVPGDYQFKIYSYKNGVRKLITEYVDVPVRP